MQVRIHLPLILAPVAMAAEGRDVHFDAAPYATPLQIENGVGLQWSEIRRVTQVLLTFVEDGQPVPRSDALRVE